MPDLELLKGTRDYLPQTQIVRSQVIDTIRELFERYGFNPAETPIINFTELLASKYAGGEEILKEIYTFSDQGERDLALRYDLTVPFARLVGKYQPHEVLLPFKRYEIGRIFRDGPVKAGRLREFTQCDMDAVGIASPAIEAEMLSLAGEAFEAIEISACCHVNHVDVLKNILTDAGVPEEQAPDVILSIDKIKKIGRDGVAAELADKGITGEAVEKVFAEFDTLKPLDSMARMDRLAEKLKGGPGAQGIEALRLVFDLLGAQKSRLDIRFEPSLARGLQIYTGTVYEFFCLDSSEFEGSIAAGGRYDEIIGRFLHPDDPGKARDYPAVGLSFGLEPITYILEARAAKHAEGRPRKTVSQVIILPLGETRRDCLEVASRLRQAGVRTEVDHVSRRAKKCFSWADRMGVPFVMVIGENEIESQTFAVKNLISGEQRQLNLDEAIEWMNEK